MATSPALAPTDIETWTIRKLRTRIIPFIFVLMVIAFLDRINIGFAALTMNRELAITSQQFGFLAGIFFFGYFIFEIPSNLLLHKIGARIWIARILISWGIVAMLTGFSQTVLQLYFVRFLLGVAEAGFIPGILLYLTYWFRQREQAQAIASFLTAGPVTSIFGAAVSGLILDHVHWFGVSSWRWLLILEGIPAILGGVLTYFFFLLPGRPAEARFLTATEKDWITTELAREEQQRLATRGITAGQALKARFSEYSNTTVGTLVMIPYVVGLTAMILVSRGSDHALERRYHAAIPEMVGAIALFLLGTITAVSPFFSIALWCFVVMGVQNFMAPFWSLPTQFLTGFSAAAGIALINSVGNLGGFAGPYATGATGKWTGSLYGGLVFTGFHCWYRQCQHSRCGKELNSTRHVWGFGGAVTATSTHS